MWAHIAAYNLIRTDMAQAAARHDISPRSIAPDPFLPRIGGLARASPFRLAQKRTSARTSNHAPRNHSG
jgi:hypothetical protein